jgi:hypothetical protein
MFLVIYEIHILTFEVVNIKIMVFWNVIPDSLVNIYQRFGGPFSVKDRGSKSL